MRKRIALTSKYHNKKTTIDGINFDSKKESKYYPIFKKLEQQGKIKNLILQEKFHFIINGNPLIIRSKGYPNGRRISYSADYSFFDMEQNKQRVIDIKGLQTDVFKIKKALMESCHGIIIEII